MIRLPVHYWRQSVNSMMLFYVSTLLHKQKKPNYDNSGFPNKIQQTIKLCEVNCWLNLCFILFENFSKGLCLDT